MILDESIIEAQKEFITKEFGIQLINSEERDDRNPFQYNGISISGYRYLAIMNWPELFAENPKLEVHHINGDHSDNRLCNLVPLTHKQHTAVHARFFEERKAQLQEQGYSMGTNRKDKPQSEESNIKRSNKLKGRIPWNNNQPQPDYTRQKISESLKEYWRKKKEGLI